MATNNKLSNFKKRLEAMEQSKGIGKPIVAWLVDKDDPNGHPVGSWLVNGECFAPSVIEERAKKANCKIILAIYSDDAGE